MNFIRNVFIVYTFDIHYLIFQGFVPEFAIHMRTRVTDAGIKGRDK